jgi:ferritin-like metal-binding protein YciE
MIEKAHDAQLKLGFETHLRETENHVKRLEKVFQMHGTEPLGVDCPAIDGIIDEADDVAGDVRTVPFWMLRSLPPRKPSSTTR